MAFKVFNNREAEAEAARQARLQQKVALQTQAMLAALRLAANIGTGAKPKSGPKNAPPGHSSAAKKDTGPTSVLNLGH